MENSKLSSYAVLSNWMSKFSRWKIQSDSASSSLSPLQFNWQCYASQQKPKPTPAEIRTCKTCTISKSHEISWFNRTFNG